MADLEDVIAQLERMEREEPDEASDEPVVPDDIDKLIMSVDEAARMFDAPKPPMSIEEALYQRLSKFQQTLEDAKLQGNSGKVRRMDRIVKSYQKAIKDHKAGRHVDFQDLVSPPGFAPIPLQDYKPTRTAASRSPNSEIESISSDPPVPKIRQVPQQPAHDVKPPPEETQDEQPTSQPPKRPAPLLPDSAKLNDIPVPEMPSGSSPKPVHKIQAQGGPAQQPARPQLNRQQSRGTSSIQTKQLNYLLERQKLFKEAALESKQKGDIQQAKEYLRKSKGFDPLIEATKNGLPIDATSIPTPPQLEEDFVMIAKEAIDDIPVHQGLEVTRNDVRRTSTGNLSQVDDERIFQSLVEHLNTQIEMCKLNKEHFMKLGDISTGSKFERLSLESRKDLDSILVRWRSVQKVPLFHYENRSFSILVCNTDVAANELILEIGQVYAIPAKPDIDTYVKWEFGFPTDAHQSGRTYTVKNSCDPKFNETFKLAIDRKSRSLARVFKRNALKVELWSKGGFFKNDSLIGTAQIKPQELENRCTMREAHQLFDGRKPIGAKIEIVLKIREPLLSKQVEEVKQKWLVLE